MFTKYYKSSQDKFKIFTKKEINLTQTMDISTQYILQHKLTAYQTPKFYQDTSGNKSKQQPNRKISKKLTIFDQIIKAHSRVPGPGKYVTNPEVKIKEKQALKRQKQKDSQKTKSKYTFLDAVIKRSKSLPSVGRYNIEQPKKAKKQPKSQHNASHANFRPTIFEGINDATVNTGPGLYAIRQTISQRSPKYSIAPEPKKQVSLPKIPSPGEYNPIPSSYSTFEKKSLQSLTYQDSTRKTTFGERIHLKVKSKSPGPVYNLITNWGKKKNQLQSEFNLYKSVSLGPKTSIYHPLTQR